MASPDLDARLRTFAGSCVALAIALALCSASCRPPNDTVGQTGDVTAANDCDENLEHDSLPEFARKCTAAIGVDVPGFDCDSGTPVPENHLTGSYPTAMCDAPNVLNGECDPGSRFQVLKQTADVSIVAHCRKKGLASGKYGDIAVIQYNQKDGATCFYQALGNLDHNVTAPRDGNGPGKFPWKDPKDTAAIQCVQCHDNGPFVRSPYLAQLRGEPTNRLPGTNPGSGPWDHRFSWNKTIPYMFIGNDFQSWKAYSLSITGTGSGCLGCHRLGLSSVQGSYLLGAGTAQNLGLIATAMTQAHKNPHSNDAPIWMTPGQITYSAANETEAKAAAACAAKIVARGNDPNAPNPPAGCQATLFAHGNTCRSGPITAVINGATQSTPTNRVDVTVDLGACQNPADCPPGFCYWKTLHGPFWQTAAFNIPIGDPNYRGSYARIFGENGIWKARSGTDSTGGPPSAPPGGTAECTRFNEIVAVPDQNKCFANQFTVFDKDGTVATATTNATVAGATTANVLSGFIGNVAQANTGTLRDTPDFLRVSESNATINLSYAHATPPPSPLKPGPLTGEAWIDGCQGWTADYVVKDVHSTGDVLLVPAAQTPNVRCFITGITGAWSSTQNGGTVQPFAEIYIANNKDTRLRVSPASGSDRVGAYASCIRLK
jgi:hypothetical protein